MAKYSGIPPTVEVSVALISTSRGLTNPEYADEVIYRGLEKEIKKSRIVKITKDYFNGITRGWSARGTDKSKVIFKVKTVRDEKAAAIHIILTMIGSQQGIDRFHMIDTEGRKKGAVISVSGNVTKLITQESGPKTFGLTAEGEFFDINLTSKGKKRKKKVTQEDLDKYGVEFKEHGQPLTRRIKKTNRKAMPLATYDRMTKGPEAVRGTGTRRFGKNGVATIYSAPFSTRVIQGAVEPKFYTRYFMKKYVYGNSRFRKDLSNAARRALRKLLKQRENVARAIARKEAKAAARKAGKSKGKGGRRPYKGKGKFIGRARRTGPRGSNTATSKQRVRRRRR